MPPPAGERVVWEEGLEAGYIGPKGEVTVAELDRGCEGGVIAGGVEGLEDGFSVYFAVHDRD